MFMNATRRRADISKPRFAALAPVVAIPLETQKIRARKAEKPEENKAFWVESMHHHTQKRKSRYAIAPPLMFVMESAGQRLERDGGNNYALAPVTAGMLNEVYLAAKRGDDRYKKYMPRVKKTGKIKEQMFKSEYYCQHEISYYVPIHETEKGPVRSKIRICGSTWCCPICAAKIAIRRNIEVHKILDKARAEGMSVFMITLTAPHYAQQRFLYLSEHMQAAYAHFDNSDDMKALRKQYDYIGKMKTTETMMGGAYGWHNHFHVVYVCDHEIDDFDLAIILETAKNQWATSCITAGVLDPKNAQQVADFRKHAVKVTRDFSPDYIAKQNQQWKKEHNVTENWGVAEEITLSHIKKGDGSCTPFGYIARAARFAAMGCYTIAEMERDTELFIEYCCGIKGRSMVQFSQGLREWAGLKEKTDKQICKELENEGKLLGGFDRDQHAFVRKNALWKPFKKLLMIDQEKAINIINEIFQENGLRPFYSVAEMELLIYEGNCSFPDCDEASAPFEKTPPPKIGEVYPKTPPIFE